MITEAYHNMKVVVLCGGRGMRLKEETDFRPKPLVEIGDKPIVWHIMKIYAHYGYEDFILCLGYKGEMLKTYFINYRLMTCDFTVELGKNNLKLEGPCDEEGWKISLVNTGVNAMTGARVKKVDKYIDSDLFMLTYGDAVADIDINKLVRFHKEHGKIGTVTGVRPPSRFGALSAKGNRVIEFEEKPQVGHDLINGGFFVFNKKVFDYLNTDDSCALEGEPLQKLARDGELMVFAHKGFWQCMDTYRELELLNRLWAGEGPPWYLWKQNK